MVDAATNALQSMDSTSSSAEIDRDNSWKPFTLKYSFDSFPVKHYIGKLMQPDFTSVEYGNDQQFREFISERIVNTPINFAGKYSIIGKSCGAMCSAIYMIDRQTGKIFSFPEADGHWGYRYYPNSSLLLANASLVNDSMTKYLDQWGIEPEFYQWNGAGFKRLP